MFSTVMLAYTKNTQENSQADEKQQA